MIEAVTATSTLTEEKEEVVVGRGRRKQRPPLFEVECSVR
jgi:hypothetical protein